MNKEDTAELDFDSSEVQHHNSLFGADTNQSFEYFNSYDEDMAAEARHLIQCY